MSNDNNPANRLLKVLEQARGKNQSESVFQVWTQVFGLAKDDSVGLFRKLSLLVEVADEVEDLVRTIPDLDHERFLKYMPLIRQGLCWWNFEHQFSVLHKYFSDKSLTALDLCGERIAAHFPEELVPEEQLKSLIDDVHELFHKVSNADINSKLKKTLLELLATIRRALDEYHIRGAKGLQDAVELSFGMMLYRKKQFENSSTEEKTAISQVAQIVSKVLDVTVQVRKYIPLVERITKYLPWLGGS